MQSNLIETLIVSTTGDFLTIQMSDGAKYRYHAIWLRDNAQDVDTGAPDNGQKRITLFDIPVDTRITMASAKASHIKVTFAPENKIISFSANWLLQNAYDHEETAEFTLSEHIVTWDRNSQETIPTAHLSNLHSGSTALQNWLKNIRRYGFAKLTGGSINSGALLDVVSLFGYVRETNYGKWFDVRTEINLNNLTYAGLGLQAHTGSPYRDPVPTLQILYCLENSVKGGENIIVDGFRAVERLREVNQRGFDLLCGYPARFEYTGEDGIFLQSRRPMIELSPEGRLIGIRFNNRSIAPIIDVPFNHMADYYAAYRQFAEIIDSPDMAVSFKLDPGESFIVDNTRILHARLGYSSEGSRWMQGCYADKDGLLSTLAAMEHRLEAAE